jgi:Ca2+-binding EF-hand superfamily protein
MKVVLGKIVLALLLAALLMPGCATPQENQAQSDRDALCAALDTNHDGKITKEEFLANATDKNKAAEIFDKCDSGKKGYLTYDDVWAQRTMLPPEISMMTPPRLRGLR